MGTDPSYEFTEAEQEIWDLMAEGLTTMEIIERFDRPPTETMTLIRRIFDHRGTPGLEAIDRSIERLRAIRFV